MTITLNGIQFSYSAAIDIAEDIESASSKLKKAYRTCEQAEQDVASSWTGDNATRYLKLLAERKASIKDEYKDLDEIAAAIRKTADLYRGLQMEAYREQEAKAQQAASKKQ